MNSNSTNKFEVEKFWQDVLTVIVLYNSTLQESATFQSLKTSVFKCGLKNGLDILICNNSLMNEIDIEKENEEGLFHLYYLHDPKNPGVSQSYNRAAELAGIKNKKWLFILDQDTILPIDLPIQYQRNVSNLPNYPIYAPQVYSDKALFSPCRYLFMKGSNLPSIEPGVHLMIKRNVLNSGLLIDLGAFYQAGGYDETVPLYFSDFVFFDRLKNHFKTFVVLKCCLNHQLSSVDYTNTAHALTRFSYYCVGARQASLSNECAYLNYAVTVGLRSIVMSYRFQNLRFLRVFVKDFIIHQ